MQFIISHCENSEDCTCDYMLYKKMFYAFSGKLTVQIKDYTLRASL